MADIPIEKKSGGAARWLWLLALLALIALLIWFFTAEDRVDVDPVIDEEIGGTMLPTTDPMATGEPITGLAMLVDGDAAAMVGREVRLSNVPAGRVPTDAGFWITADSGERMYVVLNEVRTPNTDIEGMVNVTDGSRVDIVGTVRSADEGAPEGAAIPGPTKPLPEGIDQYIEASVVTKTG